MAKRTDWLDFAHQLVKERERIQDGLPPGVECSLSLSDHGYGGATFGVTLLHVESKCSGYGHERTPAKALESAKAKLKAEYEKWQRRPRIAETKALPAARANGQVQYIPFDEDDYDPRG